MTIKYLCNVAIWCCMQDYCIVQNFDGGNIDGLASLKSLMEKILTGSLRQPVSAI